MKGKYEKNEEDKKKIMRKSTRRQLRTALGAAGRWLLVTKQLATTQSILWYKEKQYVQLYMFERLKEIDIIVTYFRNIP